MYMKGLGGRALLQQFQGHFAPAQKGRRQFLVGNAAKGGGKSPPLG